MRVNESALTGIKVTHVAARRRRERAGSAPGDELIAVGGWRVPTRRRGACSRPKARTPIVVGRHQRLLTLALASSALAGAEAGAVQLKPAEKADAEARRRYEAWIAG